MDKNIKDKVKDFFRKEGFYVVLLVFLCVVATVAVLTMNKSNSSSKSEAGKEFTLEDSETTQELDNQMNNAERVQENTETEVAEEATEEEVTAETSSSVEVEFSNPVDGMVSRGYTYPTPIKVSENTYRNIKGIDIETKVGTPVKVAAEGVVEAIGNGAEEGVFVIVSHSNGIKTKYANLDPTLQVNKGDNLAKDTVIGKVGSSSKIFSNKEYGEHLNLQVLDSEDKQLDPVKYFNYEIKE